MAIECRELIPYVQICLVFPALSSQVTFRQINEVQWTAEYVEMVLLQNRTMLYAICFIAWSLSCIGHRSFSWPEEMSGICGTSWLQPQKRTTKQLLVHIFITKLEWVHFWCCNLFMSKKIHSKFRPKRPFIQVQMRFEKGSPIRGFSLGATAGTLAGHRAKNMNHRFGSSHLFEKKWNFSTFCHSCHPVFFSDVFRWIRFLPTSLNFNFKWFIFLLSRKYVVHQDYRRLAGAMHVQHWRSPLWSVGSLGLLGVSLWSRLLCDQSLGNKNSNRQDLGNGMKPYKKSLKKPHLHPRNKQLLASIPHSCL